MPIAEKLVGHRWTSMGTDFNKEKFKIRAKDVDYNFAPPLEDDMIDSANNLKASEIARDHIYTPFWNSKSNEKENLFKISTKVSIKISFHKYNKVYYNKY